MLEEYGMISTFGGRTESPTVDEDQLLITGVAFGWGDNAQGQHRCFAFDKKTGDMRWTSNTGGRPVDAPYGTPIITVVNGERLVGLLRAVTAACTGYRRAPGEKVFGYVLSKRGTNATPLIVDNKLIACSSEENPDNGVERPRRLPGSVRDRPGQEDDQGSLARGSASRPVSLPRPRTAKTPSSSWTTPAAFTPWI